MDVRVHADVAVAVEREDQHQVRGLAAHARQRQQLLHRPRHAAGKPIDEDLARRADVCYVLWSVWAMGRVHGVANAVTIPS